MDPGNFYNGPINGIVNYVAGVFHEFGQDPAPAPALQIHVHQQPAAQMPAPQNQLPVRFGRDILNHENAQAQNGGFGVWNVNLASQRLQAQFQEVIRGTGPDRAAPHQALWQLMGGNAAPLREAPIPVPQPVLQSISGNGAPLPAPIPSRRRRVQLRAARRLDS